MLVRNNGDELHGQETRMPSVWILGIFKPSPSRNIVISLYKPGPKKHHGQDRDEWYLWKVPALTD